MRIVLAASEVVPLAKTGGLADVVTGLSKALNARGHEVTVIMPYHRQFVAKSGLTVTPLNVTINCEIGGEPMFAELMETRLPTGDGSIGPRVLLIDHRLFFDRAGLYGEPSGPYPDNPKRWCFFSRAVIAACHAMMLNPDIVHVHDWQTGLIPALVKLEERPSKRMQAASVLTIHNLAFQGNSSSWDMRLTGLDWSHFHWTEMEFYGQLSLLKTGLVFAEQLTTVSPTYAKEIQTPQFGYGMQEILSHQSHKLTGILNGVDIDDWNPATDRHIAANFSPEDTSGKAACKADLQRELSLPQRADAPIYGMVSRLTPQKGLDILADAANKLVELDAQFVFLGTGDGHFERFLRNLADEHPQRVATVIGFSEKLAHQIEAGSDMFLMPSSFEPCGLNQMYSQLYGTPPIVTAVGGLADSVTHASDETLANGTASGFVLEDYSPRSLIAAVHWAHHLYRENTRWDGLRKACMQLDRSWDASAEAYERVYEQAAAART